MLFRSGRTYSLDHLDMEAKLDIILKELQNLKVRVDRLKSKSNEKILENCNNRRRDESTCRPRISKDDIICRIKIDPLTFDGIIDPKFFIDWMINLDCYFDWYSFTVKSRIQFARMRLTWLARIYWTSVERVHEA